MTIMDEFTRADLTDMFAYLDDLRESGSVNMFGAGPYVEEEFSLGRHKGRFVVMAWASSFDGSTALDDRVTAALSKAEASK